MLTRNLDFSLQSARGEVGLGPAGEIWCESSSFCTETHPRPPCPAGRRGPSLLLFRGFLRGIRVLQLGPHERQRVAHGLRLEFALEGLVVCVEGWVVRRCSPSSPHAPPCSPRTPSRPSGAAHLDLLSLSCQNLVRKGGLDSRDWKETGSRHIKDPGMMGGGPEETRGGGARPGDRGEERGC